MNLHYLKKGVSLGKSMTPLIAPNDHVFFRKIDIHQYHRGDIIVFSHGKRLVSHRLVQITKDYFIAKGDNTFELEYIKKDKVMGKLMFIKGKFGIIHLDTKIAGIINLYFLFYSLTTRGASLAAFWIVSKVLRGRKLLAKLLTVGETEIL